MIDAMGHREISVRIPKGADKNMIQQIQSATTRASRESRRRPNPTQSGTAVTIRQRNAKIMVGKGDARVATSTIVGNCMKIDITDISMNVVDTAMIDRVGFICCL